MGSTSARDYLALAADVPLERAVPLYQDVAEYFGVVKVGLSLFVEHGPAAVERFLKLGARVFLDLKLHDIPNTVELAASRAASLGVSFLTVHAAGGSEMLKAAVRGANSVQGSSTCILAVTVLTSLDAAALSEVGQGTDVAEQVNRLGTLAHSSGVGGLVMSAQEVASARKKWAAPFQLCTPGIRPSGSATGDQARVETPGAAIEQGSSLLVIGRPVYQASSPKAVAKSVCDEIDRALAK